MKTKKTLFSIFLALAILLPSCAAPQPGGDSQPAQTLEQTVHGQVAQAPPTQTPPTQAGSGASESGWTDGTPGEMPDTTGAQPQTQAPAAQLTPISATSDMIVHFIDVGQADCILIELPNAQIMLIDGGNRASAQTVLNYLMSQNVETIDFLVITHPHEDHIGGLPGVIDSFNIGEIYMPRVSHTTQIFERMLTAIQNNGYQINTARAGVNILSMPGLQIDIVAPVGDSYRNLNNYSAIVKLTYEDISFLFTGDAEIISENEITADIKADVLKVAHHGSSTSTSDSFLSKVDPAFAVILVGEGNTYGHPSEAVLSKLFDIGADVYRTDESGTIIMTTDGETVSVRRPTD
jgi:competence protein ComEC